MQDAILMVGKLVLAALFGGIVGYEREVHDHPAGLRTHILVCMGSALITLVSLSFRPPVSDPSRIAAQIVSGIGFLGAGTILRQGSIVRGLTTAASLWTVSGIGMAVGVGGPLFFMLAAAATLIVFLTLSIMRNFEPGVVRKTVHHLRLDVAVGQEDVLPAVLQELIGMGATIQSVQGADARDQTVRSFRLSITLSRQTKPEAIAERLAAQDGLVRFDWT